MRDKKITEPNLRKAFEQSIALNDGSLFHVGPGMFGWYGKLTKEGDRYTAVIWHDDNGLCIKLTNLYANDERAVTLMAHDVAHFYRYVLWPSKPSESIRDWYMRTCPDDPEGKFLDDVPFYGYLAEVARKGTYYVCGVDDSIVRQRITAALDAVMDGKGADLYELWKD